MQKPKKARHTQRRLWENRPCSQSGVSRKGEMEKMQLGLLVQLKEATVEDGFGSAPGKHSPLPKHRKTLPPMANSSALLSQLVYGLDTQAFFSSARLFQCP